MMKGWMTHTFTCGIFANKRNWRGNKLVGYKQVSTAFMCAPAASSMELNFSGRNVIKS